MIQSNLLRVRQRIADAEQTYHRPSGSVQLIAVSKHQNIEKIRAAYRIGQRLFAENYLQECQHKMAIATSLDIEWHFIGQLQSRKCKDIARSSSCVHSVDRLRVAIALNKASAHNDRLDIFLQVNIDHEPDKAGVLPEQAPSLVAKICELEHLRLRGLMIIPNHRHLIGIDQQRKSFARVRKLAMKIEQSTDCKLTELSMGMSGDLEAAIAEGASHVRVGTDIFGPRQH